jgi:hypothetical protein
LIPLKVKGEEAPKGGLQRKVSAEIKDCVPYCRDVCIFGINIILHVEQEGDTVLIFEECFGKRENRAKAQDKLRRSIASS